ncbi:ribosomal RNA-processing protein 7 homolog A [Latimeria chalumnae]|uniref:Ribosomal RNA processing 7 homolog A n=1 Tax=Latimeria chalumnae TaxID=7897 RepID=H3A014_LATCH|nr:PREDICTED: ribosomal RNA-processing protein 7 homolog A [Latimeria chalumnae]|eukprot:XP_006013588.1 PREDICTED: ribosomal RNA-processing protein 7 homolog A [Latimeria chalumnae]
MAAPRNSVNGAGGFTAIPVRFSEKQTSHHYLYLKEHQVRADTDSTRPRDRTLFVINVPPYCLEESLLRLFSRCGPVQSVELQQKPGPGEKFETPRSAFFNLRTPKGFKVAYVVFRNLAGVKAAKSLRLQDPFVVSPPDHPVNTGVQKWIASYAATIVSPEELQAEVDVFMQEHDRKVAEEEARAEEEEGVPDEEGWVKITRKGRHPGIPRTEAANLRALVREKRKRAQKELLKFYAWQHRDSKREYIAQLRKKFEEDKQKIALLKAQRKFRPY